MFQARLPILFTRWVLVWYALTLGASIAAPVLNSQLNHSITTLSCSTEGVKLVIDGKVVNDSAKSGMDCPLCASFSAPTMAGQSLILPSVASATVLTPMNALVPFSGTAPPLPSRGPPNTDLSS